MNAEEFVGYLQGVKRTKPGAWLCRCPAHVDKSPSLSVAEGDDGKVLIHCFAGCDPELIAIAAGVKFSELFPEKLDRETPPKRRPPLDAIALILRHSSLELLMTARDFEAKSSESPDQLRDLHKTIAKVDECLRALS